MASTDIARSRHAHDVSCGTYNLNAALLRTERRGMHTALFRGFPIFNSWVLADLATCEPGTWIVALGNARNRVVVPDWIMDRERSRMNPRLCEARLLWEMESEAEVVVAEQAARREVLRAPRLLLVQELVRHPHKLDRVPREQRPQAWSILRA